MSDILKYNSWDTTEETLECWYSMPKMERAQHTLAHSIEYKAFQTALSNQSNINALREQLDTLDLPKMNTDIFVPEGVGNVQRK